MNALTAAVSVRGACRRHGSEGPSGPSTDGAIRALGLDVFAARFILFGLVLAQLADAFTFTLGVARFGIGLESNGIATALYAIAGMAGVLAAKAAVLVATIGLLVATAQRFPRLLVWGGAAATALGLLGFLTNTASMLIIAG